MSICPIPLIYNFPVAIKEGVSINQFIATVVAEKISALATEDYLQARAQRADSGAFAAVLAKVAVGRG
ncbi:hypothetical protein CEK71_10515 [Methylovulum psychrotolerans]|uniref:Toxin-antitoxin system HicB family antitoxin n=1 Tax=Methylovulum psychrotolerans TaxID=1704499 RepID=A0A1Z4BYY3_9GAMM|nr:hypothetical protein CEK71_10515 [Methylovulum psychrotolerans]